MPSPTQRTAPCTIIRKKLGELLGDPSRQQTNWSETETQKKTMVKERHHVRKRMRQLTAMAGVVATALLSFFLIAQQTLTSETTRKLVLEIPSIDKESTATVENITASTPSSVDFLAWEPGQGQVRPRAFDPWPLDQPLPCFPPDGEMTDKVVKVPHNASVSEGFFFLKTFKTASSTSAGVNLRIARNVARRQERDFLFCKSRFDHSKPWKNHGSKLFGNRTSGKSYLWAILRDPTKRAVSKFFHFQVSRHGSEPTDALFQRYLRPDGKSYYVQALSLRRFNESIHDEIVVANEIIRDYDFIGVTERIDESFVAMAMLLDIPLSDVFYLSAKVNGNYDAQCGYITPSFVSPGMEKFFASDAWLNAIKEDFALYEAANRSLDLTIDRLGRDKFEHNLSLYKGVLAEGHARCANHTVFPCMKGKKVHRMETGCLWSDAGCGADCLDEVAREYGI
jgi:hypothetical protein